MKKLALLLILGIMVTGCGTEEEPEAEVSPYIETDIELSPEG